MSVVSSRVSSVSSIIKATGLRSQLIKQSSRAYFKLPKDIKNILYNYKAGKGTKEYEKLLHSLRNQDAIKVKIKKLKTCEIYTCK